MIKEMIHTGAKKNPIKRDRWRHWNWELTDSMLSRNNGISRERVRQIRILLGKPKAKFFRQHDLSVKITRNKARYQNLTVPELQQKLGLSSYAATYAHARKHNLTVANNQSIYPWEQLNWDLPAASLARIWNIPPLQVHSHRYSHNKPAPRWSARFGIYPKTKTYRAAIRAEKAKAAAVN